MDEETTAKFAALEAQLVDLRAQFARVLSPPPAAPVLSLKEAAFRSGFSRETMRRRLISGQVVGEKIGGKWIIPAPVDEKSKLGQLRRGAVPLKW